MIARAAVYGILGLIAEILWTGLGSLLAGDPSLRSHTYLWMFPIYSLAVFLEPIHDRMRNHFWFFRGLIYMCLFFAGEYITGLLLKLLIGLCPWHYSSPLAVKGLIRLDYGPAWFAAGLIFEKVHDFLDLRIFSK